MSPRRSAADLVPYWIDGRRAALAATFVLAVVLAFFGWQVLQTRSALTAASAQAEVLQQQLSGGDSQSAKVTLAGLQASTEDARSSSDNVLWSIGARVPFLGRNVSAIRTVATEIDRVADQAAPPVVDLAGQVSSKTFSPTGGSLDVSALAAVGPAISQASAALDRSRAELGDVDADSLLAPLRGPVGALTTKVDTLSAVAGNADLAVRLLPEMLGATGTRRYLLLNQNNAEIRPTGGIPGSFAVITVRNGRLSIGNQGSIQDMPPFARPVKTLTTDESTVFPSTIATDIRDVNITPDFPRSASIARAMVEKTFGVTVDGVVSIDPVALGYLLTGTGPVDLGKGVVLDSGNAVSTLLNRVYTQLQDPVAQDDFFARANRRIFSAFTQGQGDPSAVLSAFVRGVDENRITFWAARKTEQQQLAGTALSGASPGDDGRTPHVAVYLSDAASTKMEYYLDFNTSAQSTNCLDGGRQVISTTTDLTSSAPQGKGALPASVTGSGDFVPRGSMRLNIRLFAPFDGSFTTVRLNGEPVTVSASRFDRRNVTRVEVVLKPGQTATITTNSTSGPGQTADPVFTTTPGIESLRNDYRIPSAC